MHGNIELPNENNENNEYNNNNENITESKCRDDEKSGLKNELYGDFRDNPNGIMGFTSYVINELTKYQ